mmetsp:Transcript_21959/g.47777  ORF Transcript_21959/g.47777 Transcript_21959/m.47777 type:complete len:240 (+) Transcript_21959:583-1302(+)
MSAEESNNNNNNESNNSATVRFNVGGTVYEVSRSLLELFPDTMLSRMVSETWLDCSQGGDNDDRKKESPIFVDRNGDRFQYVLDYMRDGQNAILPVTVPKEAFLKDLEYYGFENVDANTIKEQSSLSAYLAMAKKLDELDAKLNTRNELEMLAHYCFLRVKYSGDLDVFVDKSYHNKGDFARHRHEKYNDDAFIRSLANIAYGLINDSAKQACFAGCLSEYGLNLCSIESYMVTLQVID